MPRSHTRPHERWANRYQIGFSFVSSTSDGGPWRWNRALHDFAREPGDEDVSLRAVA